MLHMVSSFIRASSRTYERLYSKFSFEFGPVAEAFVGEVSAMQIHVVYFSVGSKLQNGYATFGFSIAARSTFKIHSNVLFCYFDWNETALVK